MMRKLSLDVLRIDSPCNQPWESMAGDARSRHCGQCNRSVHDLSALTEEEAMGLLAREQNRICVRYAFTPDGTILTRAPEEPRLLRLIRALLAPLIGVAATGCCHLNVHRTQGEVPPQTVEHPQEQTVMGARVMGTPPPLTEPATRP